MHKRILRGISAVILAAGAVWMTGTSLSSSDADERQSAVTNAAGQVKSGSVPAPAKTMAPSPTVIQPVGPAAAEGVTVQDNRLEEAILMVQDKDYAPAVPILEEALKRDPTQEFVWEALGWAYYYTEQAERAEQLWKQYFELLPESPKAHMLLAQLSLLKKDWREADRYLKGSLDLDPDNYDIRFWYAQNLLRLGRLEPASELLLKLYAKEPERLDIAVDLAHLQGMLQNYDEAVSLWSHIIDMSPDNLDYRMSYSRALMLVGAIEESEAQARMVLSTDKSRRDAMHVLADIAGLSQLPERVVEMLEALVKDADDPGVRAELKVRLAAYYVDLWRKDPVNWTPERPLELLEQAIDARPDYVPWLNQYTELALIMQKPGNTERMINRVLTDFNPNNQRALRARFELALQLGRFDLAEQSLRAVFDKFNPDDPFRHLMMARLRVQEGRYREAMDELDRLEEAGSRGTVFGLLYHGLTKSEWLAMTSTRRLEEHIVELQKAGYTFIAATEAARYLEENRDEGAVNKPRPWLARQIDKVHYAWTGERRTAEHGSEIKVHKVAFVTFDDGLKSSFQLGTPIAADLGVPFTMFVIASIDELNAPMYAAWEEVAAYHQKGGWEIGSHLMYANTDKPASSDTNRLVFNLSNRIWKPDRNRIEPLREWSERVRREFEESRIRIERFVKPDPESPMGVAYPYGEIGQEEGSNLANIVNPIKAILNEARRIYQAGFLVDQNGYTCFGESPFMISRYEPGWDEDAHDVVRAALMNHPVQAARRMRAELAALMGRPYLARHQLKLLENDGYPEEELRQIEDLINRRVSTSTEGRDNNQTSVLDTSSRYKIKPSDLYISAAYRDNRANEEISISYGELGAGLSLNPYLGIAASAWSGEIKQTLSSNVWYNVKQTTSSSSTETLTQTVNGQTTTQVTEIQSSQTRDVQTNRIDRSSYEADIDYAGGGLFVRVNDRAAVSIMIGEKTMDYGIGVRPGVLEPSDSSIVGSMAVRWQPDFAVDMVVSYSRDVVLSARDMISYDALGLSSIWDVSDSWRLEGRAGYSKYEDENAMMSLEGISLWEMNEDLGIWAGAEASTYTLDKDSQLYWSPYWDTRIAALLRWRRSNAPRYSLTLDVRLGQQREKARPEEEAAYLNLKAQAESDGTWDPGSGPGSDWSTFLGASATYRHRIGPGLEVFADVRTVALREYAEHDVRAGVQVDF
jgi:tetratricopeptide (TPR) repeat protein